MLPDLAHGQDIFGSPELRTKMKILHAVDKSLDRITIAEICENAGISRQTLAASRIVVYQGHRRRIAGTLAR